MNAQVLAGHPARLRDGGWGAHVNSPDVKTGDTVHIETRSGKQWVETVDKVIWTGRDSDGNECALVSCVPRPRGEKGVKVQPASTDTASDSPPFEDDDLP